MNQGGMKLAAATMMFAAASCSEDGKLEIRSTPSPFAAGKQAVSFRVAEANGQFALGNVALALEGYRKALREDPASLDALTGLAACYDRMGRFDLSRRYHEMALALAPGDARLYANFASTLELQGQGEEASAVRAEMAHRLAVAAKPVEAVPKPPSASISSVAVVAPVAVEPAVAKSSTAVAVHTAPVVAHAAPAAAPPAAAPPAPARSVTIALSAPRPASPPAVALVQSGPRLERLSLGEVALVTNAAPLWRAQLVGRSQRSATIGFRSLARPPVRVANVILLNAARSQGLAARTRSYLSERGWSRLSIGDASRTMNVSTIVYPASRRETAVRLANQFGFALRHQPTASGSLTIMLGRDAAASGTLRATRG